MNRLTTKEIGTGIYRLQEDSVAINVDSYLIVGKEQALVIDGLQLGEGLYDDVRKITNLPLTMIITHGHPDHMGNGMREFMEQGIPIYYPTEDIGFLREIYGDYIDDKGILSLQSEASYDLGGRTCRVIPMSGHTLGSRMIYLENEHILFSSDAIGSGNIWMQVPGALPLSLYIHELHRLQQFVTDNTITKIYPGHSSQIKPYNEPNQDYLDKAYLDEYTQMTQDIIDGRLIGKQVTIPMDIFDGKNILQVTGTIVGEYSYDGDRL